MSASFQFDVVIVGAGPAGLSTALHLIRSDPSWSERLVILEAAQHPRPKICGGGVTFHAEEQLRRLDVAISVPEAYVDRLRFAFGGSSFTVRSSQLMRVVQRADFDAALAQTAHDRGVQIHSNERVIDLQPIANGYRVVTDRSEYAARVIVAADGAKSVVRQRLDLRGANGVARLLNLLTPVDRSVPEFADRTALFDFGCLRYGVQGYVWSFPCQIGDQPMLNRGVFDSRMADQPRARLKQALAASLGMDQIALDDLITGHPVRWFDPQATFALPHVLLVGDAAGVDPLFAEGISYALEYGALAAAEINAAFERQDWTLDRYRERVLRSALGAALRRKRRVAQALYAPPRPRVASLLWLLAGFAPHPLRYAVGAALDVLPRRAALA